VIAGARYEGLLRFEPADGASLLDAVNPGLGPILGLVVNVNSTGSAITVARAENLTDLVFFRKHYVQPRNDYVLLNSTRVSARAGNAFPPMSVWIPAGGKGTSREDALLAAMGEYFERFQGAFQFLEPGEQAAFATRAALTAAGRRALGPDDISFFHDRQLGADSPYTRFTDSSLLSWTAYRDVVSGAEVLVPVQIAFLSRIGRTGEELIAYSTTGGLAFGRDPVDAFAHGLLEYIERDAINLGWISGVRPKRILIEGTQFADEVRRLAGSLAGDLSFLEFQTDQPGVFVVGAFGHYRGLFVSGAGADFTFEAALFKAAGEIMQCYDSLRDTLNLPAGLRSREIRREDLFEFSLILQYYSQPEKRRLLETWIAGLDEVSASALCQRPPGSMQRLVEDFRSRRALLLVKEFPVSRCLPSLNGALVRVLPPDLVPAHVPSTPFLGHPRYYTAPVAMGLRDTAPGYDDLYLDEPVPLP
jgi:ribosomal protein S12 methylthiotransferase accessory factor